MRTVAALVLIAVVLIVAPQDARAAPCAGFTDVDDTNPFCTSISWMKNRGVTLGCSATQYCPDAVVTRSQMAAFISRLSPMLLPALYDQAGNAVGYFFTTRAPNTAIVVYAAVPRFGKTIYVVLLQGGSDNSAVMFYEMLSAAIYYSNADCTGTTWAARPVTTPISYSWGVVGLVNGAHHLFTAIALVPSFSAQSLSYRSNVDGSCVVNAASVSNAWTVQDTGPFSGMGQLFVR